MRWLRWGTSAQMSKPRRASSTAAATTPSGVLTQNFAELPQPKGRSDTWTSRLHTSPTTVDGRSCSQFQKYYSTEMCSASETGSYLRRIDFCITQAATRVLSCGGDHTLRYLDTERQSSGLTTYWNSFFQVALYLPSYVQCS